jgi:hypothetical protein
MSKPYLALFNLVSAVGWGYILALTVQSLLAQHSPAEFYQIVGEPLKIVQSLAILEIVHSILRLVPSPVMTNILQVGSRLFLVWGVTSISSASQAHWSLYLMVGSWSLVEVPRYLFYALNLFMAKVPLPLFWMRYNFFQILYPTGITGELLQTWNYLPALKSSSLTLWYVYLLVVLSYVPGSPVMFFHMVGQKGAAWQKRNPRPTPPPNGIEFPITNPVTKERGTTEFGKAVLAASVAGIDDKEKDVILGYKNWRFGYNKLIVNHSKICAKSDPKTCVKIAQQGLDYLHNHFVFLRDDKVLTLAQAMKEIKGTFHTGFMKGTKPKPEKFNYKIPYLGKDLEGEELLAQIKLWADKGVIEPSAERGIRLAVTNQKWLDLSDKYFVLLGAGSAMGPLKVLLSLGANVIAVDLDRQGIWENLFKLTKDSCGTLTFPLKKPQTEFKDEASMAAAAGCNLFTQTPEISNWVQSVQPGKPLVVGGYAYLDGALHVKVAVAMDAIMAGVCAVRPDTSLAFLCTPTDCHAIPQEAHDAAKKNLATAPWWQKLVASWGGLKSNVVEPVQSAAGFPIHLVDGVTVAQGPNYALAKRMQHWRAIVAHNDGFTVSTNIAPSTKTISVVSNVQFAAAYNGMHHFVPMEVMYQETSNAVMGALLVHDVCNQDDVSNGSHRLKHPLLLFASGGFHGGVWRTGYTINSLGFYSALIFYAGHYKVPLFLGLSAVVGFLGFVVQKGAPHNWL